MMQTKQCNATGFEGQNMCTRDRGHAGEHRCKAADTDARAATGHEYAYEEHLRREGREAWNDNPDGCYFCGSIHHHSDCCLERGEPWEADR